MKILAVLMTTLLLQGCLVMGAVAGAGYAAAKIEYDNYAEYSRAQGVEPLSMIDYQKWAYPRCVDRQHCDRSKLANKDYRKGLPK